MKLFDELKWRGLINDITSLDLEEELNKGGMTFYIGIDPTGDSLHIGHFSSAIAMSKRLLDAGHNPIIIAGGGTGLIGDPKPNAERAMLSKEDAEHNIENIKKQIDSLLHTDVKIVNNADWLLKMNAIDYLRDYGKFFNVNYMLSKDTVKRRLDIGITYTEFSYMILQSIDFLKLYEDYNCTMQIGGQDQWGNITSGLELIRKIHGIDTKCYGMTMPLLTKADGTKFGKTESGDSVWLDKNKTTPYQMYQFFVNSEDTKVIDYLKMLTFVEVEEIKKLEESLHTEPEKRLVHKTLAFEMVKFIHGEEDAIKARNEAEEIFKNRGLSESTPTITLNKSDIKESVSFIDLIVLTDLFSSKSEARRMIEQGAISVNDKKITDINKEINIKDFDKDFVLKKGKKNFYKIVVK